MSEKAEALSNVYNAVKDTKLSTFSFFDDALIDQAVYAITLDVTTTCDEEPQIVDESINGPSGNLQWRSVDKEIFSTRYKND